MSTIQHDDIVKIHADSKLTLETTIPNWMSELTAVNFDLTKLDSEKTKAMEQYTDSCFIGELHQKTAKDGKWSYHDYTDCEICSDMSLIAPYVFGSKHSDYDWANVYTSLRSSWDQKIFRKTKDGIQSFLEYTAKHIELYHPKIIKSKKKYPPHKTVWNGHDFDDEVEETMTVRITFQCKSCRAVRTLDTKKDDINFKCPWKDDSIDYDYCDRCGEIWTTNSVILKMERMELNKK